MVDIAEVSRSLDEDMRAEDYEAIIQKTDFLLQTGDNDGQWRWVLYCIIALGSLDRRQDAVRLAYDFLTASFQEDVLIRFCVMVLRGGAAFGELLILREIFSRYNGRLLGNQLMCFKAEIDFHLGQREAALTAMAKLPADMIPSSYTDAPAPHLGALLKLINDVHIGDIDAVYRNFESVRRGIVPGTLDDMRLISIVGRLECSDRVRKEMKSSICYEISGAKIEPNRSLLIETMLYSGEEHLLDLHLNSMPFVDHFIIIQGDHSFTGKPKTVSAVVDHPRFTAFAHKITSIIIRFGDFSDPLLHFPWFVEAIHRNAAHATVLEGRHNDVHIISDVDEVLRETTVSTFKARAHDVSTVRIREHKFFLNLQRFGDGDHCQMTLPTLTTMCTGRVHAYVDPQTLRNFVSRDHRRQGAQILDGGWHFSSVLDAEGLADKYSNYSHVENTAKLNRREFFAEFLRDMRAGCIDDPDKVCFYGVRGLPIAGYMPMPITLTTYPKYLVENPHIFWGHTLPFPQEKQWADVLLMLNRRSQ